MYCVEYKNFGFWQCAEEFIFFWSAVHYATKKARKTVHKEWRIMGASKDYRQIDFVPILYITKGID